MRKSTKVKKTKVSKPVASTRRLKKFDIGGGTNKLKEFTNPGLEGYPGPEYGETEPKIYLKPKTPLEAAKDLKINPPKATAQTLEQQTVTPTKVSTPKSVATKSPKTVSDSYKKSLQGLMDKGRSIDELVKDGYGTKQGLTNLGLTAPKKATATKPSASKKPTASDLKKEGQRLKAEGMKQKGIGMAIKGKALRNKAIDKTMYEQKYSAPIPQALIKLGANPKKPNLALRTAEAIAASRGKLEMSVTKGKNRYSTDGVPSKSKLTKVEKEAIAKYKASPKYKKPLKLDSKEFNKKLESVKSGENNYGNNIVGDLIGGPLKAAAAAVGAGAGIYGLYKAGKNLSNVGKAFTKSVATKAAKAGGSQVAANTARKVALAKSSKQFANKRALKVAKDKLAKKVISKTKDPIKGAKDLARNQRAKVDRIQKGGLEKLLKKSDKVVKSKKVPEPTVGGRTKSQVDAFAKRNKKAIDNDWAIIDSYRRGGKANTSKKTVAKVSVMRRGSNK